jgi:hypothetical protein
LCSSASALASRWSSWYRYVRQVSEGCVF